MYRLSAYTKPPFAATALLYCWVIAPCVLPKRTSSAWTRPPLNCMSFVALKLTALEPISPPLTVTAAPCNWIASPELVFSSVPLLIIKLLLALRVIFSLLAALSKSPTRPPFMVMLWAWKANSLPVNWPPLITKSSVAWTVALPVLSCPATALTWMLPPLIIAFLAYILISLAVIWPLVICAVFVALISITLAFILPPLMIASLLVLISRVVTVISPPLMVASFAVIVAAPPLTAPPLMIALLAAVTVSALFAVRLFPPKAKSLPVAKVAVCAIISLVPLIVAFWASRVSSVAPTLPPLCS